MATKSNRVKRIETRNSEISTPSGNIAVMEIQHSEVGLNKDWLSIDAKLTDKASTREYHISATAGGVFVHLYEGGVMVGTAHVCAKYDGGNTAISAEVCD